MSVHTAMFCMLNLILVATGVALADDDPPPAESPASEASDSAPTLAPARPTTPGTETPAKATVGVLTPKLQPQSVTVLLVNGATFTGTLAEADQWTMKTTFGTTSLPLSAVAGIRVAQEGTSTTTVVLHNGDNITGAVQMDQLVLQMEWGRVEIFGTHVASILFTPGLKWSSEQGMNGTRWNLVPDDTRKPAAATSAAAPAVSRTASAPRAVSTPGPAVPVRPATPRR